ncbi:MAG: hypothetical protein H7235_07870 [Bdellovibrionaceae bacterium]|nr:hypothetical protein [Pseudobdellovibrionaceae bacterium]
MKSSLMLTALLLIGSTVFAATNESAEVIRDCHLAENPDAGVRVKILNVGEQPGSGLLVAVVLSAGNVKPHIMGAYPVTVNPPNGAGIIGFSGTGFSLKIATQTGLIELKSSGSEPVHMSGNGPLFSCN